MSNIGLVSLVLFDPIHRMIPLTVILLSGANCIPPAPTPSFFNDPLMTSSFFLFQVTKERLQLERHLQIANDSLQRNNGVDLQKYLSLVKSLLVKLLVKWQNLFC
jgi:hypothetical protein